MKVEGLRDEITKAYQSTLDDHIKSDNGKMTKGGDMISINIYFVPVWESGKRTTRFVIEIEVKRKWMFCKDFVYYFKKWMERNGTYITRFCLFRCLEYAKFNVSLMMMI